MVEALVAIGISVLFVSVCAYVGYYTEKGPPFQKVLWIRYDEETRMYTCKVQGVFHKYVETVWITRGYVRTCDGRQVAYSELIEKLDRNRIPEWYRS